jgi:hypothetical protein
VVTDTISDMLTRIEMRLYGKASNCSNSCYKMSLAAYLEEEDLLKILKVIKK